MITTSALLLVGSFMMPFVPSSMTRNWTNKSTNILGDPPEIHGSMEAELLLDDARHVTTVTRRATHDLDSHTLPSSATKARLNTYAALSDGWDGEGSLAPDARAIESAFLLLAMIPLGVSVPHPMIARDGTVGFYWSNGRAFADIEIDGPGSFSIYAQSRIGSAPEQYVEGIPVSHEAVQILANCLYPLGQI